MLDNEQLILECLTNNIFKESSETKTREQFFSENGIEEDDLSELGSGDFGTAYLIDKGDTELVLKITSSDNEFRLAEKIIDAGTNIPEFDGFANIYKAEIVDREYYILQEYLEWDQEIENNLSMLSQLVETQDLSIQYIDHFDEDELDEGDKALYDSLEGFISDLNDIIYGYRYLGVEASDIRDENMGIDKNGKVKAFDIDDKNRR